MSGDSVELDSEAESESNLILTPEQDSKHKQRESLNGNENLNPTEFLLDSGSSSNPQRPADRSYAANQPAEYSNQPNEGAEPEGNSLVLKQPVSGVNAQPIESDSSCLINHCVRLVHIWLLLLALCVLILLPVVSPFNWNTLYSKLSDIESSDRPISSLLSSWRFNSTGGIQKNLDNTSIHSHDHSNQTDAGPSTSTMTTVVETPPCDRIIADSSLTPSVGDSPRFSACGSLPRVIRPNSFGWPNHYLVYDAWFSTPLDLVFIGFYHPQGDPDWRKQVRILVNGEQDLTGRMTEDGENPNFHHFIYRLLKPVNSLNNVTVSYLRYSITWHNLVIQSHLPYSPIALHATLFVELDLLPLAYIHYSSQGFSRFLWAYNGIITNEILSQIPNYENIAILEWKYDYLLQPGGSQQGQITFLTYCMLRLLPQVDWIFPSDLDEFAVNTNGQTIISRLYQLEISAWYTFRNRFAYAPNDWKVSFNQYQNQIQNHNNITTPFIIRPSASLEPCDFRGKSIYHRSFTEFRRPLVGAHHPINERNLDSHCLDGLEHYHLLNLRSGQTTGKITIETFGENIILLPPQLLLDNLAKSNDSGSQG